MWTRSSSGRKTIWASPGPPPLIAPTPADAPPDDDSPDDAPLDDAADLSSFGAAPVLASGPELPTERRPRPTLPVGTARPTFGARLELMPTSADVVVGSGPYTVPISISDVSQLSTLTLRLTFDPRVLRVNRVQEGSFMRQGRAAVTFAQEVDASRGYIDLALTRTGDTTGASGSGLVAAVVFEPVAQGTATLSPTGVGLTPGRRATGLRFSTDNRERALTPGWGSVAGIGTMQANGRRRPDEHGYSFVELLVVSVILLVLASAIAPLTQATVQRQREVELRRALREIRTLSMDTRTPLTSVSSEGPTSTRKARAIPPISRPSLKAWSPSTTRAAERSSS